MQVTGLSFVLKTRVHFLRIIVRLRIFSLRLPFLRFCDRLFSMISSRDIFMKSLLVSIFLYKRYSRIQGFLHAQVLLGNSVQTVHFLLLLTYTCLCTPILHFFSNGGKGNHFTFFFVFSVSRHFQITHSGYSGGMDFSCVQTVVPSSRGKRSSPISSSEGGADCRIVVLF